MRRPTCAKPSDAYASGVAAGHWSADPAQQTVLLALDRLHGQLLARQPDTLWKKISWPWRDPVGVQGLYLYGGVGRGKTFLCDLLFDGLPGLRSQRWHFHRFMADVHRRLRELPGSADTVSIVARDLARDMRLLVLDEFFVGDIADAMILGRLLEQLFAHGVTLVTTSNSAPDELYRDGLQRASFLPAITRLKAHCQVLRLDSAQDYRLRQLTHAATFLSPVDAHSEAVLAGHFARLAVHAQPAVESLRINARDIPIKALSDGVAWFDFSARCDGPRSVADYIEIARDFHTVLLSGVPRLGRGDEDPARRFVHLVDEFYDRHVNLLLSADADPLSLYSGQRVAREFERTSSRLVEMQSAEYLAREHRP